MCFDPLKGRHNLLSVLISSRSSTIYCVRLATLEANRRSESNLLLDTLAGRQAVTRSLPRPGTLMFQLRIGNLPHFQALLLFALPVPSRNSTQPPTAALEFDLLDRFVRLLSDRCILTPRLFRFRLPHHRPLRNLPFFQVFPERD
jgi:hypothetical protein